MCPGQTSVQAQFSKIRPRANQVLVCSFILSAYQTTPTYHADPTLVYHAPTEVEVMAHTYEGLKKMTLAQLREVAKDVQHDAVQGYTQMNKDHLLPALCQALGIDAHEHHVAHSDIKFVTRSRMRELRARREEALRAGDHQALHLIRRE
jgi:hypothetical protein